MQVPFRNESEAQSHEVFSALMWALSYPGELQQTEYAYLKSIGEVLLDLETSFYTADLRLAKDFSLGTAKSAALKQADYLFFSDLENFEMTALKEVKRGTLLYPDHAASLIIKTEFVEGLRLKLSGPGIESSRSLSCNLPLPFWQIRNQVTHYPLGWDLFLCDGKSIVGIPRSTQVQL